MAAIEVTASKGEKEVTIMYDFGENLADASAQFGEEVVFTNFRQAAKIALQARMRNRMEKGGDVNALTTLWKPGIQMERATVDPMTAAKNAFGKMSAEERAEFLATFAA